MSCDSLGMGLIDMATNVDIIILLQGDAARLKMAECEAVLLGREPIHGSANATALATLVKTLMRKSDLRRKYVLRCTRDVGLQMIPYRRGDDEGFESDEDLTSLGSYDDSSGSVYVSDHVIHVKMHSQPKSSQLPNTDATSGSVSSVGTDSANSSGASDNDDTDNSSSHVNQTNATFDKKSQDSECFAFHEVAFCHTDPSLPKVIVWVVKTRRQSKTTNEYSYGLEAIVFLCQNGEKFRSLYKNFQELSRRQKLEKPVRNRWKEEQPRFVTREPILPPKMDKPAAKSEAKSSAVMFNLIQRVDTDGVTHTEVTRPTAETRQPRVLSDSYEPSSIISINTPDSGDIKTVAATKKFEKVIESVIRTDVDSKDGPPERPERKKQHKTGKDKAPMPPAVGKNQKTKEKVVRGQFVRVSVDQKALSSPMSRGVWLFGSEAKPCGSALSYPSRLVWSNDNRDEQASERRSRKNAERTAPHHRSKSSVIFRRSESPKRYPMSHRYIDTIHINNSLPNRFFGKLKELTGSNLTGNKFRRRNSIGDLTNPNFYQQNDAKKIDKFNQSLAKSTPNLKSVIKNKNAKYYKDGYDNLEPKKVTFSAYATVQVVD